MEKETSFLQALFPVGSLLLLMIYGLIIRPHWQGDTPFPLELIFLSATFIAACQLFYLGYSWKQIEKAITAKMMRAFPTLLILFAIGLIIGSWMICGTIPMLVYYGIKALDPAYLYVLAFLVPAIFSTFTGTSYGSAGTIGIVIIGVAGVVQADLAITAGAIIGGAYLGDKMSPLSDTTNIAALATDVPLFEHIRSMMYTTFPSALIAAAIYLITGFVRPIETADTDFDTVASTLVAIEQLFDFSIWLLLPPLIVLYGSIRRRPILPTLLLSTAVASMLALLIQDYTLADVIQTNYKGYETAMAGAAEIPDAIQNLFERGGLYELNDPIIIAIMVFIYIGTIDVINAMPILVNRLFGFARSRAAVIISSLFSAGITNAMTSNQYATSFVVGDAFKTKYDKAGIDRKVLSRSLEDYGTMIESIIPWTTTAVFMSATLQVPHADYWSWQLLSLVNLVIAPLWAILGIGCFRTSPATPDSTSPLS